MQHLNGYQGESPCLAIKIKETSTVHQVAQVIQVMQLNLLKQFETGQTAQTPLLDQHGELGALR